MKQNILLTVLFLLITSTVAYSAGQYDGIWESPVSYLTVNENDGHIVVVNLDSDGWEASIGQLTENRARISTIMSAYANSVFDLTFTSETTAVAVQVSCTPKYYNTRCLYPDGTRINLEKIW